MNEFFDPLIRKFLITVALAFSSLFWAAAQQSDGSLAEEIMKHAHNISVDPGYSQGNWEPLLKEVRGKQLVLLGEPNHGSKEIFVSRNDLIRSLHENAGFGVVLFESGIGELAVVDLQRESLSPSQMTQGFFGGWRTRESEQLMDYIKVSKIHVGGFDVQRTGNSFKEFLSGVAGAHKIDSIYFSGLEDRFSVARRKLTSRHTAYDSVSTSTIALIRDYNKLAGLLQGIAQSTKELLLTHRAILNRVAFLEYYLQFVKDRDWNKRWRARDSLMASNVEWFLETLYKNTGVIIVAHNFHIARFNEKEEVMGEFLKKKYGDAMYSLGVFAGKGSYLGNSGKEQSMVPPDTSRLDIETVIALLSSRVNFIPIPEKADKGGEWLFGTVVVNDTFIDLSGANEMNLSEHFDGLLLIDRISPPESG